MPSTGVREVRRGDVSIRMLYAEHAVQLDCLKHRKGLLVPLDAASFGRELVAFFHAHEQCSAGAPGVVVNVSVATPRGGAD